MEERFPPTHFRMLLEVPKVALGKNLKLSSYGNQIFIYFYIFKSFVIKTILILLFFSNQKPFRATTIPPEDFEDV